MVSLLCIVIYFPVKHKTRTGPREVHQGAFAALPNRNLDHALKPFFFSGPSQAEKTHGHLEQ